MLDDFITSNRVEIVARSRAKVGERSAPSPTHEELRSEISIFLDQLVERLRSDVPSQEDIMASAVINGKNMLQQGFSVAQVVQGYGDVCQAVTELAIAAKVPITTEEFRTLNLCLDTATAGAVSEYERARDLRIFNSENERLGFLAHELRNELNTAMISLEVIKRGSVAVGGSTGALLTRSLSAMRELVDRALAEVRLESGVSNRERIQMSVLIADLEVAAAFEANRKQLRLTVLCCDGGAQIEIDRHLLSAAVGNLLQNAFKFTREKGRVTLKTRATADQTFIDVEDQCGGLAPGTVSGLFRSFEQRSADRTGLGLGLAISRRSVASMGGAIHVRNVPGAGCVFTIELPRAGSDPHI